MKKGRKGGRGEEGGGAKKGQNGRNWDIGGQAEALI
jgi:hypothetical protein